MVLFSWLIPRVLLPQNPALPITGDLGDFLFRELGTNDIEGQRICLVVVGYGEGPSILLYMEGHQEVEAVQGWGGLGRNVDLARSSPYLTVV